MFQNLVDLYRLLTRAQRRRLIRLQILVVLMAFAEVAGVLAIGPFMSLVGDMSRLEGDGQLAQLYALSGLESPQDFLFWMGVAALGLLFLGSCLSMFTVWRLSMYSERVGAELSTRLFQHYMQQPWLFHSSGSSSQLINRISQECRRITDAIITPVLQMNAKATMALFMIVAVFVFNPMVALIGVSMFVAAYVVLYRVVRMRLSRNGQIVSKVQRERFQLMNEGFGGIKDVLLLGRQRVFDRRFAGTSQRFARARGVNKAMGQVPRYAMELVAFGGVIFLVLYLLAAHDGNLGEILPLLAVFGLAGFKLLPAFQQIYNAIAQVRGNIAAFETIRDDLYDSREAPANMPPPATDFGHLVPKDAVELRDVVFHYPGKETPALNGLNLRLPANRVIGVVGASGSGKSTAIDILLGLIEPASGEMLVDGKPLDASNRRAWQNAVGFVPQAIFLADASIRENIAFGIPPEEIDDERVRRAAHMAHLDELLAELPKGLDTRVGERGVQLSGGQRQRIGIARALYDDAEVLVFDEATSALDGITERLIMEAIHDFAGKKTIIMIAHRLATVRKCDCIYLMANGKVIDQGTYDDLASRNLTFKRMAEHA